MANKDRFQQAEFAAMVGIVGNVALAIIKGIVGVMSHSKALIADAVHSASDVIGSLAVYVGLKAAKQPPDEDHPYGHGKAESIAAIIVAVLLFLVGIKIGKSSLESFFTVVEPPKSMALYVIILSIIVKEAMFRYKYNLGTKLGSQALIVNAYEHRSDVYSSIAALIGVGAAVLSKKVGLPWLTYGDPLAGLFVSVLVLKMAYTLGREAIHTTLDHVLPDDEVEPFRTVILADLDVKKINSLHAREHGHYVIVDLKIAVDPHLTVEEGHAIGKRVKAQLLKQAKIHDVFVHINPLGED
ncbi:cation diffusion facilitator family transporter [Bacillus massiliigorillae]|uniref:cation diffusion facilitator family transporter n=1 Tax=Bacillus massiliigorillae TaxID=1243664 RepID=UPI0003A5ACBE|nr:cation diffusion facilitator family transporter [Bacillus massiliigorillae]